MGSWLARRARGSPDRIALIDDVREWSYAQVADYVSGMASALATKGVRPGDRVCYIGGNETSALTAAFAAGLLGATYVPLSHQRSAAELAAIVDDAGCRLVLYGLHAAAAVEPLRDGVRRFIATGEASGSRAGDGSGPAAGRDDSLSDLLRGRAGQAVPDVPVGLDDVCFLLYTSGTTGPSKGVMLTHGNVTWNAVNFHTVADFKADDVTLAVAPLSRAGGWGVTLLPTLHKGGCVVLPAAFDADRTLELLQRHHVTTLFGGPELLGALVRSGHWDDADLSSLRFAISGGNVVHETLIRRYVDRGVRFLQGYGLTEAGPMCLMIDEADAVRKLGSAGVPPMHTDVRVVGPDMADAAPNEVGEVVVHGPNVMRGYWRRPDDTDAALEGGWLHTGDAGRVDEDGFFYIVDRLSHAFVSDGRRVFPARIEAVLAEHPEVIESAVVPAPRPSGTGSQAPVAIVVTAPGSSVGAAELISFCTDRLPAHEVPVDVEFRDSLPKNAAGKVLRTRLVPASARVRRAG
jgi:fatty-acyl-CoA synthase